MDDSHIWLGFGSEPSTQILFFPEALVKGYEDFWINSTLMTVVSACFSWVARLASLLGRRSTVVFLM